MRDNQEKLIPLSEEIKILVLDWASPSLLSEGKTVCSETTRDYGNDGCVSFRLGSSVSNASPIRLMVSSGIEISHQLVGV